MIRTKVFPRLTCLLVLLVISVSAQDSGEPIIFDFAFHGNNPVLSRGAEGEWDSASVLIGCVVYHEDMFYMLYAGSSDQIAGSAMGPSAIGLAISEDGLTWVKHENNPVLEMDAAGGVWPGPCIVEDDTWVLFVTPRFTTMDIPGNIVLRATASYPGGPWTVEDEIMPESPHRWDYGIVANSVIVTDAEYVLYYFGFDGRSHSSFGIGRATSPNGVNFTKYDDPGTTDELYVDTDPVFTNGTEWDEEVMLVSVQSIDSGWEMFYTALPGSWRNVPGTIAYATSEDGITWVRYGDAPILGLDEDDVGIWWPQAVVVDGIYFLYFNILPVNHAYQEVGVATGTITRGSSEN